MQDNEPNANQRVGMNVATLRGDMSQAELAQRLARELGKASVDPTTITRLEAGKRPTTVNELEALARIFKVEVSELLADPSVVNDAKRFQLAFTLLYSYWVEMDRAAENFQEIRAKTYELMQLTPGIERSVNGYKPEFVHALLHGSLAELITRDSET